MQHLLIRDLIGDRIHDLIRDHIPHLIRDRIPERMRDPRRAPGRALFRRIALYFFVLGDLVRSMGSVPVRVWAHFLLHECATGS